MGPYPMHSETMRGCEREISRTAEFTRRVREAEEWQGPSTRVSLSGIWARLVVQPLRSRSRSVVAAIRETQPLAYGTGVAGALVMADAGQLSLATSEVEKRTLTVSLVDERSSMFSCYDFRGADRRYDVALVALENERSSASLIAVPARAESIGASASWNETSANWECEHRFVFEDVAEAPFYQVTCDTGSWGPFSYDEMVSAEWRQRVSLPAMAS